MGIHRHLVVVGAQAALLCASLFGQAPAAALKPSPEVQPDTSQAAEKKEITRKARAAYYNLKNEGLTDFQCQVLPDWDAVYKAMPQDALGQEQVLPVLKNVHFQITTSSVSHQPDVTSANEVVADRLQKTIRDVEAVLKAFLNEWELFVVASPFPEVDGDYQIQEIGGKYHLTFKRGANEISTTMDRDFRVEELTFSSDKVNGTVLPILETGKHGFVLVGYNAIFLGDGNSVLQKDIRIETQEVEGVQLPKALKATFPLGTGKVTLSFVFTNCQVKKR